MANVLHEGRHRGEFEVDKFSDNYNHDRVIVASGEVVEPGTVLGKSTATGKFYPLNPDSESGMETPAAIAHEAVDATDGDTPGVAVTRGPYVANGKELLWPDGMDAAARETASATLLAETGIRIL